MRQKADVLFYLNTTKSLRLAIDEHQWILERGSKARHVPGKDSGYRGVCFVTGSRDMLLMEIRERNLLVDLSGRALLATLPETFKACRSALKASGIDIYRQQLRNQAKCVTPIPECSVTNRGALLRRGSAAQFTVSRTATK